MNGSDETPRQHARNRQRRSLVIRRTDHVGGSLGLVFLGALERDSDSILARLGDYLGSRAKILKAEISQDRIEVDVEVRAWPEEAARLAEHARDLLRKGASRAAIALFAEALDLDPLHAPALTGLGLALGQRGRHDEALDALRRARESGGDNFELLLAMGRVSAHLEHKSAAIAYLEAALAIDPKSFVARRALKQLGREPARPDPAAGAVRSNSK
jgi:tetratricopeptide (TPR) repeat protein